MSICNDLKNIGPNVKTRTISAYLSIPLIMTPSLAYANGNQKSNPDNIELILIAGSCGWFARFTIDAVQEFRNGNQIAGFANLTYAIIPSVATSAYLALR